MRRYQQFIQTLNNIQKVCILLHMLMDGLTRGWAGEVLAADGAVRSLGFLCTAATGYAGIPSVDVVELRTGGIPDMMALTPVSLSSVAVIGARCDDIAIGAGATLIEIARDKSDLVVHALVLSGGGTEREIEEKNAFAAFCPDVDVRLTVADLPDGRLADHRGQVSKVLTEFRRDCEPDMVFGPRSSDHDEDHRLLAELIPAEFPDHPVLGYEILTWETDLPNPSSVLTCSNRDGTTKGEVARAALSVAVRARMVRRRDTSRVDARPRSAVSRPLRRSLHGR